LYFIQRKERRGKMDKKYNIGQELVVKEDIEQEMCFGTKKVRKKGTKLYVGADSNIKAAHYLNADIQVFSDDTIIEGFSVEGIAEWIYQLVSNRLPLDDMLEDYDESPENFKECVADALEELGMYDNTGNRS
jgi:hypothetical protein